MLGPTALPSAEQEKSLFQNSVMLAVAGFAGMSINCGCSWTGRPRSAIARPASAGQADVAHVRLCARGDRFAPLFGCAARAPSATQHLSSHQRSFPHIAAGVNYAMIGGVHCATAGAIAASLPPHRARVCAYAAPLQVASTAGERPRKRGPSSLWHSWATSALRVRSLGNSDKAGLGKMPGISDTSNCRPKPMQRYPISQRCAPNYTELK